MFCLCPELNSHSLYADYDLFEVIICSLLHNVHASRFSFTLQCICCLELLGVLHYRKQNHECINFLLVRSCQENVCVDVVTRSSTVDVLKTGNHD
jgi:hypothetical protein